MSEPLSFLIRSAFDASGINAAAASVKNIDAQINKVSRGFSQFMSLMGAGGIGASLFAFSVKAVKAFAEEERAIDLRNKALQNLGITNKAAGKELDDLAESLEKTTHAQKEEIITAETSLIQRGLWGAELKKAIPTVLDLATKTGSLSSATELVGKAFQGTTKGLNTVGVMIAANTPKTQVYAETMRQLNDMFGGAAQAEMQNTAGKMELLSKRFEDLTKRAGELLSGPATGVIGWFEKLATVLEAFTEDGKATKIDLMHESLGRLDKKLSDMYAKNASGSWFKYTDVEIQATIDKIKSLTAEINSLTGSTKSTGSSVATRKPVVADNDTERLKAQKLAQSEAIKKDKEYLKESEKITEQITEIESFALTERGQMYTRYFGDLEMQRRKNLALEGSTSRQLETNNKKMLVDLEHDYTEAGHTFAGGFKQGLDAMEQSSQDWKGAWGECMNSAIGPAKTAFTDFFASTSSDFLNIEALAKKMFQNILNSFLDMVAQMMAKKAVLALFTGGGSLLGGLLGSWASGGYTGDGDPNEVAGVVHRGEFVLSAETTKALRSGSSLYNVSTTSSAVNNSGVDFTQNNTFNISGDAANIGTLCEKIAEATRNGLRQAGEMANVITKVGTKKAGNTAL